MKRVLALLALVACGTSASPSREDGAPTPTPPAPSSASSAPLPSATASAAPAADAAAPGPIGPPPSALPFAFTRPDQGTPESPAELAAATDELLALLAGTRYFDVVDERVHGWPESAGGYWYGTFWSGISIEKKNGQVAFRHGAAGADNNGLRTAPFLEGACFAHLLSGKPVTAGLVRKMARGYTSWSLAMRRGLADSAPTMLTRAAYPASVTSTDGGRTFLVDYTLDRPGVDNPATDYVHLPGNPTFGDVWIKNKRSKDDMGHVFRSLAHADACTPRLDPAAQADLAETKATYASWSLAVEAAGWSIPTLDKNAAVFTPPLTETLAHYILLDGVECPGALMMRLRGHGAPGDLACGSGLSASEKISASQMRNNVRQILRSHHEAAAVTALVTKNDAVALELLRGLVERLDGDVPLASQPTPPANVEPNDIVSLVLEAAATGVPLTSAEVRWVHQRLHAAYLAYLAPAMAATYRVFDPATPDGTYAYEPGGAGMAFADLGVMLGACASPWRNPAGRPLLDCAKVLAALP